MKKSFPPKNIEIPAPFKISKNFNKIESNGRMQKAMKLVKENKIILFKGLYISNPFFSSIPNMDKIKPNWGNSTA